MAQTRYIVPNFFTSVSFMLGILAVLIGAIFYNPPEQFSNTLFGREPLILASWMIIWCTMLDKLDGFAAKIMNASSGFGAQFDSLADLIAFGVAPAFLGFFYVSNYDQNWARLHFPLLLISLTIYVLCTAMRLARYNSKDSQELTDFFHGIPSTFSGGFVVLCIILIHEYNLFELHSRMIYSIPLIMILMGLGMVSPLYMPKIKKRKRLWVSILELSTMMVGYICGFGMIFPEILFSILIVYLVSGISYGLLKKGVIEDDIAKEAP